jgi:hypothetical protein
MPHEAEMLVAALDNTNPGSYTPVGLDLDAVFLGDKAWFAKAEVSPLVQGGNGCRGAGRGDWVDVLPGNGVGRDDRI